MASAGIHHPDDVQRDAVSSRIDRFNVLTMSELYPEYTKGCLLNEDSVPTRLLPFWKKANVEKF